MKVSVISTVMNEEDSIAGMLESLEKQTYKPNEIVLTDGGSKDRTKEIIRKFQKKNKKIRLIDATGASRMKGRNIAIENAKHEVIAFTDGGCIADEKWLENLMKRIKNGAKAVAGNSSPLYKNLFEQCQGHLLLGNKFIPATFHGDVFPSARSEAMLKQVWRDAGGFAEDKPADDAYFHFRIADAGYRFVQAPDAIVRWRLRKDWKALFKQFFNYSKWDAQSGLLHRHPRSVALLFGFYVFLSALVNSIFLQSYTVASALVFLLFLYGFVPAVEVSVKTRKVKSLFYGFGIQFTRRLGYIIGYHYGLFSRNMKDS